MNTITKRTKERKKQLLIDLCIITAVSFTVLGVLAFLGNRMNEFAYDVSINIAIRVAVIGICAQFGISGLGSFCMCCNVYLDSLCGRCYSGCINGYGGNLIPYIWNVDCEERDRKCMGLHTHFLCVLECTIDGERR